ncbi:methyltransferase [Rosenbergiella collisarenosi]|uniref:tRNA1(Val) (adenine(37)-N6)-methyltransferase n=1 Tax=Rosenbergiella collisarenosi TaxID=1544695 RepID=UPI001BDA1DFA|nr:methyltransferase [Rosenbergiella collisarenosi]MBT0720232.1 methyltransferase [Rosenbergiella collisarenosi]
MTSISSPLRRGGFTFKQFFVGHDRCGMKVSTDGVLLGAWAPLPAIRRVLDIGTGSGLLALMLAQRLSLEDTAFEIDAIDIDNLAVEQAIDNCTYTPWRASIRVEQQDFLTWDRSSSPKYGLVICNPPYFEQGKDYRDVQREKARDSRTLGHRDLLRQVADVIADNGFFSLILPQQEAQRFEELAHQEGWMLHQQCEVRERINTPVKRVLMTWCRHTHRCQRGQLIIRDPQDDYSADFKSLTQQFYLAF